MLFSHSVLLVMDLQQGVVQRFGGATCKSWSRFSGLLVLPAQQVCQ
jgi:hypothetical protein